LVAVIRLYLKIPLQKMALKSSQSNMNSEGRASTLSEYSVYDTFRTYFKQLG